MPKSMFGRRDGLDNPMKAALQNLFSSLVRYLLPLFGGWVATHSGIVIAEGDASTLTIVGLVAGLAMVGLTLLLKWLDGTKYGSILRTLIGPKVEHHSWSIARLLVALLSGVYLALTGDTTDAVDLDPGTGEDSVVEVVVVIVGLLFDRASKALKP